MPPRSAPSPSAHRKSLKACTMSFLQFCHSSPSMCILLQWSPGVLLSDDEIARARQHGQTYLLCWQKLSYHAIEAGIPCYRLRPKMHYVAHIMDQLSSKENPRTLSNFLNEDLMGRIVKMAKRQHRLTMVRRTSELYVLSLQFRWRAPK